jgi:hypothetical protein
MAILLLWLITFEIRFLRDLIYGFSGNGGEASILSPPLCRSPPRIFRSIRQIHELVANRQKASEGALARKCRSR